MGLLSCAVVGGVHAEISPWSYGATVFGSNSFLSGVNTETKINTKAVETKFLDNLWGGAYLHGEFTFSDYLGVELNVGYLNLGGTVEGEEAVSGADAADAQKSEGKKVVASITTHGISIPLHLCAYPLGREEDEGIFKVFVGPAVYIPLGSAKLMYKGDTKGTLTEAQKKELPGWDWGINGGLAYEWDNGLSIKGMYGLNFKNRFNLEANKSQSMISDVTDWKSAKTHSMLLGVGYNLAALFAE